MTTMTTDQPTTQTQDATETAKPITVSGPMLAAMLKHTASESSRYSISGVLVTPGGYMVATDGRRLAVLCPNGADPKAGGHDGVIVPRAALKSLGKAAKMRHTFRHDGDVAQIHTEERNGRTWRTVATTEAGANPVTDRTDFPPYTDAIPPDRHTAGDDPADIGAWNPDFMADAMALASAMQAGSERIGARITWARKSRHNETGLNIATSPIRIDSTGEDVSACVIIMPVHI